LAAQAELRAEIPDPADPGVQELTRMVALAADTLASTLALNQRATQFYGLVAAGAAGLMMAVCKVAAELVVALLAKPEVVAVVLTLAAAVAHKWLGVLVVRVITAMELPVLVLVAVLVALAVQTAHLVAVAAGVTLAVVVVAVLLTPTLVVAAVVAVQAITTRRTLIPSL